MVTTTTPALRDADPLVAHLIDRELGRQRHGLELIASENFASRAVIDAMGTPLTNNTRRVIPAAATTAAARSSTRSSSWPSTD